MAKMSDLPNELLRSLFLMISPKDRKTAALVSRRWRNIGEDPVLWKWCIIYIHNRHHINKLYHRRILHVQEIEVSRFGWKTKHLEQLLQATLDLPQLKRIDGLASMDLHSVNSELLARALVKLEELRLMENQNTTNDQRSAIFNEIPKYGCVKKLTLCILELDAEILAKVIPGLEELTLIRVSFTSGQVQQIFKSMSENGKLNKVWFSSVNLSSVEPEIFGLALSRIETVDLHKIMLSSQQAQALLTKMGQNSAIKSFSSVVNDLSAAEPRLFARALSKLEELNLCTNNLTNDQARALFIEQKQNCKLKSLYVDDDDLSSVDEDDLATVVANLEEMSVNWTQLSTGQITSLLTRAQQNTNLKMLSLLGNRISGVDSELVKTVREIIGKWDFQIDSESQESDEDVSLNGFIVSEEDTDGESDN